MHILGGGGGEICPPAVTHSHAEGTECLWPDQATLTRCLECGSCLCVQVTRARAFHFSSRWILWVGLGSRSVCDADAGGRGASYRRRGKRTEQATNSAGLRSLGLGCCTGERRKPGRTSSDARVPRAVTHFDPRGAWAGAEDDPGLVQEYPALCLLQREECAARPAGGQQPSSLSSQPGPRWGRQGPGAKGRRPASARGPGLCGNPAGAAATAAWRREAARSVLEKFVGPEPSAPPHKPAPLKQAGDEA